MKFSDLKSEAKDKLYPNYGFFLLLLLPSYILGILAGSVSWSYVINTLPLVYNYQNNDPARFSEAMTPNVSVSIISLFAAVLMLSATFTMIKIMRNQDTDFHGGFKKGFNIFTRGDYFFGAFLVGLLKGIYIFLWTILSIIISTAIIIAATALSGGVLRMLLILVAILFIIAALVFITIKSISYSQAQFIFRDGIDSGNPIGYNESITKSRQLMNGHKGEYFLLWVTFIPWFILGKITFQLANIFYVTPYSRLTFANYYAKLTQNK